MKAILWILVILAVIGALFIFFGGTPQSNQPMPSAQSSSTPEVVPISHASLVLKWGATTVYADPVGAPTLFTNQPRPNIILITHEHPDHFSTTTLEALMASSTTLVIPQSVADQLPPALKNNLVVMKNGDNQTLGALNVEAIPAYNLRQEALQYHPKGRDNGYIVSDGITRVYIAGDTDGTPEMKALQNIDIAFVPMNLPYTMSVEDAAQAVLAFKPKHVYPYHYRGTSGFSDTNKFKQLVNASDPSIDVVLLNWYPQ